MIRRYGGKQCCLVYASDLTFGVSYETPVFVVDDGVQYVSDTYYSVTTSRHIGLMSRDVRYTERVEVPQEVIDRAVKTGRVEYEPTATD